VYFYLLLSGRDPGHSRSADAGPCDEHSICGRFSLQSPTFVLASHPSIPSVIFWTSRGDLPPAESDISARRGEYNKAGSSRPETLVRSRDFARPLGDENTISCLRFYKPSEDILVRWYLPSFSPFALLLLLSPYVLSRRSRMLIYTGNADMDHPLLQTFPLGCPVAPLELPPIP
jgi:hypothetical protein